MKHGSLVNGTSKGACKISMMVAVCLGLCLAQSACTPPPGKLCAGIDCGENGQCVVVGGGANCECVVGYHPEGLTCIPDGDAGVPDGAVDSCGNGVSELDEMCDGEDLRGETCVSLGGDGGELSCRPNCAYFDTSDCLTTCGDGFMGASEQCDATDVGGLTCLDLGYYGGALACADGCTYDLASCEAAGRCGDDSIQVAQGEECDDINLGGATCTSIGFYEGTLACGTPNAQNACRFDTAACGGFCGDGLVQTSHTEVCDATNLNGETCEAFGYDSGTLACESNCDAFDVTGCIGAPQPCGNGVIDTGEVCDGALLVGEDCASQGFSFGTLACNATCDAFVTTGCIAIACGNGFLDSGEQCDDGNLLSHDGCSSCCTLETSNWANIVNAITPERHMPSMVYDSLRDQLVVFGGRYWGDAASDQTWIYDFSTWTLATPANSPAAVYEPGMTFDQGRGVVVLYGGWTGSAAYDRTWEWDGSDWTEVIMTLTPGPRNFHGLAYDSTRSRVVLFGGSDGTNTYADTWEYDGTDWTEMPTANAPTARIRPGLAYDSNRGVVVLHGGSDGVAQNDTWEYDGVDWTEVITTSAPPALFQHVLVFHEARGTMIYHGGHDGASGQNGTWEYDGVDWSPLSPTTSPAVYGHAVAYDSLRKSVWIFGGVATGSGMNFSKQTYRFAFDSSCSNEVCDNSADDDGDGLTDCADPDCDNHPCPTGFCRAGVCMAPVCGNGYLEVGEACDDGLANNDTTPDACRTTCQLPSCGDGVADPSDLASCWAEPSGYPIAVGQTVWNIDTGDLNGDTHLDVVVATRYGQQVGVYLGDGTGQLTSHTTVAMNNSPRDIVLGHFNADTDLDMVTVGENTSLRVYLGDGTGGFGEATGSPYNYVWGNPGIKVADVNGDGRSDLVARIDTTLTASEVRVFLGDDIGGLTEAAGSPYTFSGDRAGVFKVAIARIDGDAHLDIALGHRSQNAVLLLLGDGMGGFAQASYSPISVGASLGVVNAGDVNGDTNVDLVGYCYPTSCGVVVLLGDGLGGFVEAAGSPVSLTNVHDGILDDLNGDGHLDALVPEFDGSATHVLRGDGAGNFVEAVGSPWISTSSGLMVVTSADLNEDLVPDVLAPFVAGQNFTVFLSNP